MSKRGKGLKNERRADRAYESAGMWTYRPENASYGDNDLWNLFDVTAVDPRAGRLYMIQVKTNGARGITAWTHDVRPFTRLDSVTCHFVVWHDHEGWRLIEADASGYRTVYDERDDKRVGVNQHTEMQLGDGLVEYIQSDTTDVITA